MSARFHNYPGASCALSLLGRVGGCLWVAIGAQRCRREERSARACLTIAQNPLSFSLTRGVHDLSLRGVGGMAAPSRCFRATSASNAAVRRMDPTERESPKRQPALGPERVTITALPSPPGRRKEKRACEVARVPAFMAVWVLKWGAWAPVCCGGNAMVHVLHKSPRAPRRPWEAPRSGRAPSQTPTPQNVVVGRLPWEHVL